MPLPCIKSKNEHKRFHFSSFLCVGIQLDANRFIRDYDFPFELSRCKAFRGDWQRKWVRAEESVMPLAAYLTRALFVRAHFVYMKRCITSHYLNILCYYLLRQSLTIITSDDVLRTAGKNAMDFLVCIPCTRFARSEHKPYRMPQRTCAQQTQTDLLCLVNVLRLPNARICCTNFFIY